MNKTLQDYAREYLKIELAKLPEDSQFLFKRLYSHKNLDLPINDIIDNMNEDNLDHAMQQVERTIKMVAEGKAEDDEN